MYVKAVGLPLVEVVQPPEEGPGYVGRIVRVHPRSGGTIELLLFPPELMKLRDSVSEALAGLQFTTKTGWQNKGEQDAGN